MIDAGNMELFVQDYEEDKKLHLLTYEQLKRIVKLSIELDVYTYTVQVY